MTFDEARARLEVIGRQIARRTSDGETIEGGQRAIREGVLEMVAIMAQLTETMKEASQR